MRPHTAALALLGATLAVAPLSGMAQPATAPAPAANAPAAPVAGANSFTEGQARSRIEAAGYTGVKELQKDDQGVWRGQGMRNGVATEVAVDYRGNVMAGAAGAAPAASSSATSNATGTTATNRGSAPDGTAGNPPSTMTGRAADRMQGQPPRADGTPGNPPGTAAGRATDRALGTNSTGANPAGSNSTSGTGTPAR